MSQYDEKDCDYLALHWGGFPFLFKKSMYGNSRWGYFAGVQCRIPDRSWDYLVQHYGDEWEYIPPHAERESHNAIYNIDTDYVTIQNDYLAFIDNEKVKNAFLEKKAYMFHASEALRGNQDMQRIAQAECVSLEMEKKLENASESTFPCYTWVLKLSKKKVKNKKKKGLLLKSRKIWLKDIIKSNKRKKCVCCFKM